MPSFPVTSSCWPYRFHYLLVPAALLVAGCNSGPKEESHSEPVAPLAAFRDAAEETGLIFRHDNGMSGSMYMPEVVGSGVALLDYNNDGKLDVFVVQGGVLKPGEKPDPKKGPTHKLFRNDMEILPDGSRVLKFTDVTEEAGLNFADYGMGVIAGDFDGDGYVDLYVTCLGHNRLFHNNGNGTFTDVTETAGVGGDEGWHTSAAWVDFERNGRLGLFVCSYLEWTFDSHRMCKDPAGRNEYCGPKSYPPARSHLYRNLGNGRFEDVSISSGISGKAGAALGVVCADFDGDGWPDILVANDGMANHLWINQKDGTFKEEAARKGCALNSAGMAEANMGVVAADFNNNGLDDLFVTHLTNEHATFFRNLGRGLFEDQTMQLGLDAPTRRATGFGACAIDCDNSGRLDIFIANGAVRVIEQQVKAGFRPPLRQRCQLLRNEGGPKLRFTEVTEGAFLQVEDVGRGVAFGDFRNTGAIDLVVANNNGPLRLLLNQAAQNNHWLGLRLVDGPVGRRHDVLGAVAMLDRSGKPSLRRRCATDGSYLSSSDPRVVFGLGDSTAFDRVRVKWPDGSTETWHGLEADRYHELARGTAEKE